jgi:uncharacterized membrane protein YoaK (UPF0700 family)
MWKLTSAEETLAFALLGLMAVTGLIDAVSFLSLGRVFTANVTGNIVFLGFAIAGVPEVSAVRSLTALAAFLIGGMAGGRVLARARADAIQAALILFVLEITSITAAMLSAVG